LELEVRKNAEDFVAARSRPTGSIDMRPSPACFILRLVCTTIAFYDDKGES
jgi:hypothetical protein